MCRLAPPGLDFKVCIEVIGESLSFIEIGAGTERIEILIFIDRRLIIESE